MTWKTEPICCTLNVHFNHDCRPLCCVLLESKTMHIVLLLIKQNQWLRALGTCCVEVQLTIQLINLRQEHVRFAKRDYYRPYLERRTVQLHAQNIFPKIAASRERPHSEYDSHMAMVTCDTPQNKTKTIISGQQKASRAKLR